MKDLFETLHIESEKTAARGRRKSRTTLSNFDDDSSEELSGIALREAMGGGDFLSESKSWWDLDRAIASGSGGKKGSRRGADMFVDDELEMFNDDPEEFLDLDE